LFDELREHVKFQSQIPDDVDGAFTCLWWPVKFSLVYITSSSFRLCPAVLVGLFSVTRSAFSAIAAHVRARRSFHPRADRLIRKRPQQRVVRIVAHLLPNGDDTGLHLRSNSSRTRALVALRMKSDPCVTMMVTPLVLTNWT